MRLAPLLLTLLTAASCSTGSSDTTTSIQFVNIGTPTSTQPSTTTSNVPALETCEAMAAFPRTLPPTVVPGIPDTADVAFDEFTLLAGAFSAIRFDDTGAPVIVMIRGALPPRQFTADREVVEILDGIPALVGPIGGGFWAAAWAIPPGERCDLYSLIFYPPVDEAGLIEVVLSIG